MSAVQYHQRGRVMTATLAGVLMMVAVALFLVAATAQQPAASPSPSAAIPAREGGLGSSISTSVASAATVRTTADATPSVGPILGLSRPVLLDVPRIGIHDARLMELGLAKDGAIQVPPLGKNSPAGWYRDSPTPGQLGPAVIVGHLDSAWAGPAIFYQLGALRPGDIVTVTRADRMVAVFRVDSVEKYAKSAFPTLRVYGNTDHSALRLITCGGRFNTAKRSYEDNIVVYAHLVSSHRA